MTLPNASRPIMLRRPKYIFYAWASLILTAKEQNKTRVSLYLPDSAREIHNNRADLIPGLGVCRDQMNFLKGRTPLRQTEAAGHLL